MDFTIEARLKTNRIVKDVHMKYHVGRVKVTEIDMPFLSPGENRWIVPFTLRSGGVDQPDRDVSSLA